MSRWRYTSIGLSAIVAACLLIASSVGASALEKVVVQTDWSPYGLHAGLHLGVTKGWFKEAGLDVEVLDGKGSNVTIQQVAAGQVDVGFVQLNSMATAVFKGLPVTSIFGLVRGGDNGLMFSRDIGATKLEQLKGRKIGVPAGGSTASFLDAFLKAGGVSRSDFTVVNLDSSAMVSVYTAGGVDAALSTVAFFAPLVEDKRPSSGILFSDVGLRIPSHGLMVRRETIERRADAMRHFVEVNQKVWKYIVDGHQDEAIDALLAQRADMRLDRKVMMAQLMNYIPLFDTPATKGKPIGWQAESDWRDALAIMESAGVISAGWKADQVYTNQFIKMD
jgi:NitT/TauT family transport system substrate-binding protein